MAAAAALQGLCEESTCSICLEYLKDPVITECGHNFCRACLAKCWEGSEGEMISCPQCREKVRRKLIPNLQLGNIVELTKKLCLQEGKSLEGKGGACGKHQKPLKLFCKNDEAPLCEVCDKSEHRGHQLVPLEKAAQDYQGLICRHLEFLEEERTKILIYKTEIEEKSQSLLNQTKAEIEKTKEEFREIQSFLDKQEKFLLAHLEKVEKKTAKKRDDLLARLSEKHSSLGNLIQEMNEKGQQPPGELLQDVRSILQSCKKKEPFQDLLAFRSEKNLEITEVQNRKKILSELMEMLKDRQLFLPLLQKANVTLDPDTAHPSLFLSEDGKSVSCGDRDQDVPNGHERFNEYLYVLGYVGFTGGEHYWEVALRKKGYWFLGVARKSINRKVNFNEGIWGIGKLDMGKGPEYLIANDSNPYPLTLNGNPRRIRVSLNCEEGEVAFYDVDTGSHLYTFSGAPFFGETLLPFFHVAGRASLTILP